MCVDEKKVRMPALLYYFQQHTIRLIFMGPQGSSVKRGCKQTFTTFHNI